MGNSQTDKAYWLGQQHGHSGLSKPDPYLYLPHGLKQGNSMRAFPDDDNRRTCRRNATNNGVFSFRLHILLLTSEIGEASSNWSCVLSTRRMEDTASQGYHLE